jgi:hypothetical protein
MHSLHPASTQSAIPGLTLPCLRCGDPAAAINLELASASRFWCAECQSAFSVADVREVIEKWTAVLAWLARMPVEAAGQARKDGGLCL